MYFTIDRLFILCKKSQNFSLLWDIAIIVISDCPGGILASADNTAMAGIPND